MSLFTVYQYRLPRALANTVNAVGWDKAAAQFDEIAIQRDVKFDGGKYWKSWMLNHYTRVAHIYATDMNQVFELGNGYGPQDKVHKLDKMHSVSVGDVIQDHETGSFWVVDPEGFSEIHIPANFEAA